MYWQREQECMDREALAQLQLERLQATLTRVARNVPFYKKIFDDIRFDPDAFLDLSQLAALPFTTKADLRDNYPYGLFAVPLREVVRLHASSGTTGKAVVVGYTKNDLSRWADLVARIMTMAGLTRDDVLQIAFGYSLFTGGFGMHDGAQRLGASVIPASSGHTARQIQIIQDYRTTALACTPSYALHLADAMEASGVNVNALSLRWGLFGAETWSEAMRTEIQDRLKLTATDNYGISEVMGPGVAGECLQQRGMHVNEDHFLIEIIDPLTGAPLPEGELGELVITTLTKEAFPMLRFRTGDLTRILPGPCPCGRTLRRIERIRGRSDDMFIVKGVNVFPSQVEQELVAMLGAAPPWRIELTREAHLDHATLYLGATEQLLSDQMKDPLARLDQVSARMASALGVHFQIRLADARQVERDLYPDTGGVAGGKARRVQDKRMI